MSFSSACFGCSPSTTARPPQNGSTYLRSAFSSQIGLRCDTSQRFPPAHFRGGFKSVDIVGLQNEERTVGAALRGRPRFEIVFVKPRMLFLESVRSTEGGH